jgi:hypothetical protein
LPNAQDNLAGISHFDVQYKDTKFEHSNPWCPRALCGYNKVLYENQEAAGAAQPDAAHDGRDADRGEPRAGCDYWQSVCTLLAQVKGDIYDRAYLPQPSAPIQ